MTYSYFSKWFTQFSSWLIILLILDIVLRGLALWRSAKRSEKWWFIALLIVNSVGILPGIYLLTHRKEIKARQKK